MRGTKISDLTTKTHKSPSQTSAQNNPQTVAVVCGEDDGVFLSAMLRLVFSGGDLHLTTT